MPYNLFPAVDEEFNFPQSVRQQLAKSPELRNLVVPMSEVTRNALTPEEIWDGRTIYNTTRKTLETWQVDVLSWVQYLDSSYTFPTPPAFWDENYDLPVEVRTQLAKSAELRNMIKPMTQTVRDNLTVSEKWDGRTIYNITSETLETWHASQNMWVKYLDEISAFAGNWISWTPKLEYGNNNTPIAQTSSGEYIVHQSEGLITASFLITINETCPELSSATYGLEMHVPLEGGLSRYFELSAIVDYSVSNNGRYALYANMHEGYEKSDAPHLNRTNHLEFFYMTGIGGLDYFKERNPYPLVPGVVIEGQVTYPYTNYVRVS